MIQIIIEDVKMPSLYKRKFKKGEKNDKWFVIDTESDIVVFKGKFEDVCLAWYNLNKKYYLENEWLPEDILI